jgi:hypothetical protein
MERWDWSPLDLALAVVMVLIWIATLLLVAHDFLLPRLSL